MSYTLGDTNLSKGPTDFVPDALSRRSLLRGAAGLTALSVAGCQGPGGGSGGGGGVDPVQERVEVDPADIEEGGTFRTAVGANPDTFDFPESSSATASILHNLIFEGMVANNAAGEIHPWLAESFERVEVQSVAPVDYADYMTTVEYAEIEDAARARRSASSARAAVGRRRSVEPSSD